ncbi:pilus assembly protein [Duganella sp. BuS-21]|uniref:pilus assembly protein n=1 Tax=Duganella sp. BuS-21 TaxID=2943848 RepID=UPI0035A5D053
MNGMRWRCAWIFATACMQAHAGPSLIELDSLPVTAACHATAPAAQGLAGTAEGAVLLRPAPLASASASMSPGDLYQATMDIADWAGHFSRYLLPAGAAAAGGAAALAWDAGTILSGAAGRPPEPMPAQRQIYTAIVQRGGALKTIPFTWSALSAAQQALLNLDDHAGEQRLAYLRGDRSLEGIQFRRRSSVLGDAIHSTPVYVGAPERRATIYLGANDGMLHAFDATTGIELFAYVPDALIAQLHHLSYPAYTHRAYVDGPASAAELTIGGSKKTMLFSAMGGGAKGVFALDVTDPQHFAGALWEFTDRDDPMMGNVTTLPQVARLRVKKDVYRYFAIIASGVNNGGDGKGALFLLALDKPPNENWQRNSNYYRITTPVSDPALANALSSPVLVNDSDGALRYAYAGDLQGALWRFDFSGSAPWEKVVGKPLFVARDADGRRQQIMQQPLLAYANSGGYIALFGTGKLIEPADRSTATATTQSYYAIIDSLRTPMESITSRRQLTQRFLDSRDGPLDPGSQGWYVDFVQPAERSVHAGLLADGAVLFNTVQPGADWCSPTHSRSYVLNVTTGLAKDGNIITSTPNQDVIVSLPVPGYVAAPSLLPQSVTRGERDAVGRVKQEKTYAVVQVTGAGQVAAVGSMRAARRVGRLSWREIVNWRELHEAAK